MKLFIRYMALIEMIQGKYFNSLNYFFTSVKMDGSNFESKDTTTPLHMISTCLESRTVPDSTFYENPALEFLALHQVTGKNAYKL